MDRKALYDLVVIGGGHAGIEAAHAGARLGCATLLVTLQAEAIGRMSCNPAIGGQAKGQIVREIDALGGVMGLATDACGIQFRILNRSHGPAVWGPRAQCDKARYARWVQQYLAAVPGLTILEGSAERLRVEDGRIVGVIIQTPKSRTAEPLKSSASVGGREIEVSCAAVVVTTGTFLRGLMHTGETKTPGGRIGEPAMFGLPQSLEELGFELGRLKTGTPPRIYRDSVDFASCEPQPGDEPPEPFSYLHTGQALPLPQVCCHITRTVPAVHDLIRANLARAPLFSGQIKGTGPRYCPSIEDKVVKFADKPHHHIFLEPEGLDSDWVYCNGISTSLPADVQEQMVRLIPGLHQARIAQYGYAVEYDFVPPHQVGLDLQTKRVRGLFLAGQINGTSGYEEAAGQGLVAGINAARYVAAAGRQEPGARSQKSEVRIQNYDPFILRRHEAYIGVMIDDLVTRPPVEPYRMFTSRAEYRLSLRSDNADQRLTPLGRQLGLVDDRRWARFDEKRTLMTALTDWLHGLRLAGRSGWDLLRDPNLSLASLLAQGRQDNRSGLPDTALVAEALQAEAFQAVEIAARYAGYLERQAQEVARLSAIEDKRIPREFDFLGISGLGVEARQRLAAVAPATLGQASRISGITPADITVLLIALTQRGA